MKILQVHPTFTFVRGGVERHIKGLSKHLVKRGHEVTILACEMGKPISYYDKVMVKRVGKFSGFFGRENYDVIHVHGYRVPWANVHGLIKKVRGHSTIMTTHGIYPPRSMSDALLKKIYDFSLGKINLKIFDALIALSPKTKQCLLSFGASSEKIRIIPNAIDLDLFKSMPSGEEFLNKYAIPSEARILLCVGRIDWAKGFDTALRAFALIKNEIRETMLVVIGKDYGYLPLLRELASKLDIDGRVIFTGEISERLLHSAYAAADLLLLTSTYEGLPTVVLEAMACDLPVVATRSGGTPYMIEDGETGFLVDPRNVDDLAELTVIALNDEKLRKRITSKAKGIVEERYDWKKNSAKIEHVYNTMIERSH